MAEFLVLNQDHWIDLPSKDRPDLIGKDNVERKILEAPMTIEARTKSLFNLQSKYDARTQKGDIVEVREDGRTPGWLEKESYMFIEVPEMHFEEAKQYMKLHTEGEKGTIGVLDTWRILHKCKYWIDMTGLVSDGDSRVTLNKANMLSRIKVKK